MTASATRRTLVLDACMAITFGSVGRLARFDAVPAFRARGDAEVLALAVCRGLFVGSDDVAVRRHARREVGSGRLVSTLDVLVLAVRQERLTSADAERLLDRLDIGPAYRRRLGDEGKVLRDLV